MNKLTTFQKLQCFLYAYLIHRDWNLCGRYFCYRCFKGNLRAASHTTHHFRRNLQKSAGSTSSEDLRKFTRLSLVHGAVWGSGFYIPFIPEHTLLNYPVVKEYKVNHLYWNLKRQDALNKSA